jgi:hypothetical protein
LRLPPISQKRDEIGRLKTERQIQLFRQREAARRERAERREAEARVRHSNLDFVQRAVSLVLAVAICVALLLGDVGDPVLLKLVAGAGATWGALATALYRSRRDDRGRT